MYLSPYLVLVVLLCSVNLLSDYGRTVMYLTLYLVLVVLLCPVNSLIWLRRNCNVYPPLSGPGGVAMFCQSLI